MTLSKRLRSRAPSRTRRPNHRESVEKKHCIGKIGCWRTFVLSSGEVGWVGWWWWAWGPEQKGLRDRCTDKCFFFFVGRPLQDDTVCAQINLGSFGFQRESSSHGRVHLVTSRPQNGKQIVEEWETDCRRFLKGELQSVPWMKSVTFLPHVWRRTSSKPWS